MRRLMLMPWFPALGVLGALALAGCTTQSPSSSSPTASAQLLTATATDRAARRVSLAVPPNQRVFVDPSGFEGASGAYAVGAVDAALLHRGDTIVDDRKNATVVVELLARALGIDDADSLLGIPQTQLYAPVTGSISVPKVAFYDDERELGLASFRAVTVDARTGALVKDSGPVYGYSHLNQYTVMLLFSWNRTDLIPRQNKDKGIKPFP